MLDGHAGAFHRFHSRQQIAPGFGELVTAGLTQEELQAHAFFQRLQTTGHGGVVDSKPARRGRQPPRSGDLEEIAQIVPVRSEEHTSELQSLMRISYAVFCLKKKNK